MRELTMEDARKVAGGSIPKNAQDPEGWFGVTWFNTVYDPLVGANQIVDGSFGLGSSGEVMMFDGFADIAVIVGDLDQETHPEADTLLGDIAPTWVRDGVVGAGGVLGTMGAATVTRDARAAIAGAATGSGFAGWLYDNIGLRGHSHDDEGWHYHSPTQYDGAER